jgi:hypothetical protein
MDPMASTAVAPAASLPLAAPLSIAQRAYTDALHSIYSFVMTQDLLSTVIAVCRTWRAAALKEKPRKVILPASSMAQMIAAETDAGEREFDFSHGLSLVQCSNLLASPFKFHVRCATVLFKAEEMSTASVVVEQIETLAEVLNLGLARFDTPEVLRLAVSVPFLHDSWSAPLAERVVTVLSTQHRCTSVQFRWSYSSNIQFDKMDLRPLQRLPDLHTISFIGDRFLRVNVQQLSLFRALRSVSCTEEWATNWLSISVGHPLVQVTRVELPKSTLDLSSMKLLIEHMPQLTALQPWCMTSEAFQLLPLLKSLRTLRLGLRPQDMRVSFGDVNEDSQATMWNTVAQCTSLQQLQLANMDLSDVQGSILLSSLPLLESLALRTMKLERCDFYTTAANLTCLLLESCETFLPPAWIRFASLFSLPDLRFSASDSRPYEGIEWPTVP